MSLWPAIGDSFALIIRKDYLKMLQEKEDFRHLFLQEFPTENPNSQAQPKEEKECTASSPDRPERTRQ